ncbi:ankyrin repeat domain-containing protein [Wolbachia endosymbiont (group B) of Camptogramma bilineatum]|uniref:ankyrin repeat domain-containing protein n=1 Tax=Wolbachia endosymbiont (group B) of Camptogramma bilineatum TaxID=2953991 RepID=UPI00222FC7EB|nr:ankyrin repeat domain-containing protein [Wolbachia endosymbiont (group B) of Camptogramma bilineatum]
MARNSHHTILHSAVSGNNEEVIKLVLNKIEETQNQYIDAKDTEGDTSLMWAAEYGRVNAAEVLLDHGPNTEVKNNDGMTALHLVARENNLGVAELLINKGADVYAEDKDGKKTIDLARERNHSSVEKLLYENDYSLNEVATYAGEVAVGTAEVAGTVALVTAAGVAGLAIDAAVAVGEVAVGAVQAVADAATTEPSEYDVERRRRLETAAGGAQPGSLHYYQRTEHVRREYGYDDDSGCSIQSYQKQQKAYLHLSQFVSHNLQNASIELVKQGLYLPSFEARNVKINGKCTAITRGLSQALLLQSSKSFLSNLKTSAKIYERVAQGKQISKREEREVFAFSNLLDSFEQQLDSARNSLPLSLIHTKCYKTLSDLSNYIAGDFAIHLVTSNHVVAVYRTGDNYAYFDSNTAFVSGLESIDQLIEVVKKGTDYEMGEKGFLVEHFDIERANKLLSNGDRQVLTKEIKTEHQLLAEQDKEFGLIKINDRELSRVQLYDFGTKIHVEGGVPLLINADMNSSSKKFQDHLNKKEVSMTAREYLGNLKNSKNVEEVVQATKVIPFIGSKREIEEAEWTRNFKFSLVFTNNNQQKSQFSEATGEINGKPESYLSDIRISNQLEKNISF